MLNRSGISKTTLATTNQILANVELQSSVGCIVPKTLGVTVDNKKIVKAGTPIQVNLGNLNEVVTKADGNKAMNAVILHDVDVTNGNANGTALLFGFVNVNRLDSDVKSALETAMGATGVSQLITFMAV